MPAEQKDAPSPSLPEASSPDGGGGGVGGGLKAAAERGKVRRWLGKLN